MQAPNKPVRLGGQKGVVVVPFQYAAVVRTFGKGGFSPSIEEIDASHGSKGWELVAVIVTKQTSYRQAAGTDIFVAEERWIFKYEYE